MTTIVYPIRLSFTNCYILQEQGTVIVDTGRAGTMPAFARAVRNSPINRIEDALLVLTHGHWDHVGSAREIQAFTGAQLAVHRQDRSMVEAGRAVIPPGATAWGRVVAAALGAVAPRLGFPPAQVDVELGDEDLSLAPFGIPGRILYTPGHSLGSVSVLLENGDAFVGDLAMNWIALRLTPGLPVLAEDMHLVRSSWRRLLHEGARVIYPAHGRPFPAEVIRRALGPTPGP